MLEIEEQKTLTDLESNLLGNVDDRAQGAKDTARTYVSVSQARTDLSICKRILFTLEDEGRAHSCSISVSLHLPFVMVSHTQ